MGTIIHSEYIHKHSKAKDIVRPSYYSAGLSKHHIVSVVVPIDAAQSIKLRIQEESNG